MDGRNGCQGGDGRCPHPTAWRLEHTNDAARVVDYIELCDGHAEALRAVPTFAGLLREGVVRAKPITHHNSQ